MRQTHEKGTPVIRPLFYDFPQDTATWDMIDEYLFGPDILVAPVMKQGASNREVYLPDGCKWKNTHTGQWQQGGRLITCEAPLDVIPVFIREGADVDFIL